MKPETKTAPVLRFPEFTDALRVSSLEALSRDGFSNGVFNDPEKVGRGYRLVNVKDMYVGSSIDVETLSLVNIDKKLFERNQVKFGDVFFTRSSLVREGIAYSNVYLNHEQDITFDGHLIKMSPNKDLVSPEFLGFALRTSTIRRQLIAGGKTTTMTTIGQEDIAGVRVFLPSIVEQEKIAVFLSAVNEKIRQLTEKKHLLLKYKKGVMKQIFDQQIRFKDEEHNTFSDWEEKSLGEVSSVRRGASPRPISDKKWFDVNSKIGWVRISDVTRSKKFLFETEQYLSAEGVAKSRLVTAGNLIMSICATIGKPIYTAFDVCIHDGFVVFEDLTIDKEFLYYYLDLVQPRWYRYGQPGTQVNLNSDIVSAETIPVPSIDEQRKIVSFFSALDLKIDITDKQLRFVQSFRKGLLQQMFV